MRQPTVNFPSKADGVDDAIRDIVDRLSKSKNERSFDLGMYVFSSDYKEVLSLTSPANIQADQSYNPHELIDRPGKTMLASCLGEVKSRVGEYLDFHSGKNAQALILLLSDGEIDDYSASLDIARDIMSDSRVTLSSMYLQRLVDMNATYYPWDEALNTHDVSSPVSPEEVSRRDQRTGEKFKYFASSPDLCMSTIDPDEVRKHMIKSISMVSKTNLGPINR